VPTIREILQRTDKWLEKELLEKQNHLKKKK
jgi:hypothetical protein